MSAEITYAVAFGEFLVAPAPEGVDAAISRVIARHRDEVNEALAPFGLTMEDLMRPAWMRVVRVDDVVPFTGPTFGRGGVRGDDE